MEYTILDRFQAIIRLMDRGLSFRQSYNIVMWYILNGAIPQDIP